jgi:hypothetical protein
LGQPYVLVWVSSEENLETRISVQAVYLEGEVGMRSEHQAAGTKEYALSQLLVRENGISTH